MLWTIMMVVLVVVLVLVVAAVGGGVAYRATSGTCTSRRRLDGKTVLITGGSAGIGQATAQSLAARGARVILGCRNLTKARRVAEAIKEITGNHEVVVRELDVSDLDSVRRFVKEFKETETALHVLVNNAGVSIPEKQLTSYGLELTMATNHYGHFLLTNLLLDKLKASAPSRIVNVSSGAHAYCKNVDFDDLSFSKTPYSAFSAYAVSKLCNILFSKELSYKLQGTGVTSNSLHPGLVATEIFEKNNKWIGVVLSSLVYIIGKDCWGGAQTSIYLAVSEEVEEVSGKYFVDCKETNCHPLADDAGLARKLWEVSMRDVQLQPCEMLY